MPPTIESLQAVIAYLDSLQVPLSLTPYQAWEYCQGCEYTMEQVQWAQAERALQAPRPMLGSSARRT